jgi:hypothetical protein
MSAGVWQRRLGRVVRDHRGHALLLFLVVSWLMQLGGARDLDSLPFDGAHASDLSSFVWYFWHLKEALLGRRELVFSDQIFYPVGIHLVRQDWAPVPGLLALPFQVLGPIAAVNCELLVAYVLCGYFTYLLAYFLCRHRGYALLAGFVFAYCQFRLSKAAGHVSQANQQFLPLYLYWLVRYADRQSARFAALGGVSVALATFCSPYQLVYAVLLTLCWFGYRLVAVAADRTGRRRLAWHELQAMARFGVVAGTVATVLVSPLLFTQWNELWGGEASFEQVVRARSRSPSLSLDLLSFVVGGWSDLGSQRLSPEGGTAFMGYSTLLLFGASLVWLRRQAGAGVWIFSALVFLWLSMGGWLVVGGEVLARLPTAGLLSSLPVMRGASVPARYVSMVVLCIGLCIAVSGAAWGRRRPPPGAERAFRWLRLALVVIPCVELCLVQCIERPAWRSGWLPPPIPAIHREVAAGGSGQTILHVHPAWETNQRSIGPHLFPRRRFVDLTRHEGRILDGMGDAIPAATLEYYERLPLLRDLILLGRAQVVPEARPIRPSVVADARYVARQLGVRYVVVDQDSHELPRSRHQPPPDPLSSARTVEYLRSVLSLEEVARTPDAVWWRVTESADEPSRIIDFEHEGSWVHLGPGWQREATLDGWQARLPWPGGGQGALYAPRPPGPLALALSARCRPRPCTVRLQVQGHEAGETSVATTWQELRWSIPDRTRGERLLRLELALAPGGGPAGYLVGETGVRSAVPIHVSSFGLLAGDHSSVEVDAVERSLNRRGLNMVVVDPRTGEVLDSRSFDLIGDVDGTERARLVAFVEQVPAGQIVCVSVRDEGSANLTDEVAAALRSIGARGLLSGRYRHSYGVVGVKGARPGTAVEQVSHEPVHIWLEQELDLRRIRIE